MSEIILRYRFTNVGRKKDVVILIPRLAKKSLSVV